MIGQLAQLGVDPTVVALARWQFGVTTLYHYLFVPLTIGMMLLVAILQSAWVRTGKVKYLKLTKLYGKMFLINFAMGVVTGIVQEFQFGMNWSQYSRFVGDIFGAPLALEGLLAFFLEATFIGVWIFGWNRISRGAHLVSAWLVSIGTILSAFFIIAANSFMQNPVGYHISAANGRAELKSIGAVFTNPVFLSAFPHTILGAILFAAAVVMAVAAYHLKRNQHVETMLTALKFGAWATLLSFIGTLFTGDSLGQAMVQYQPMKMASAEGLWNSASPASFSLLTIGSGANGAPAVDIRIPHILSLLSTHTWSGHVDGINNLQTAYTAKFCGSNAANAALTCPTDGIFHPEVWISYWSFRAMMICGAFAALVALIALFWSRTNAKKPVSVWFWNVAIWTSVIPLVGNLFGWLFTEMGRQPWIVFRLLTTSAGVSPNVPAWSMGLSLGLFILVYGSFAVVEFKLIRKAAVAGPPEFETSSGKHDQSDDVDNDQLAITY